MKHVHCACRTSHCMNNLITHMFPIYVHTIITCLQTLCEGGADGRVLRPVLRSMFNDNGEII